MMKLALAMLLIGCTTSVPYVQVVADPEFSDRAVIAADGWNKLGFVVDTATSGLEECSEDWTSNWGDCQITLTFVNVPGLFQMPATDGHLIGHADRATRVINFDGDYLVNPDKLLHVLRHESGHLLLNCDHLDPRKSGVMDWGLLNTWIIEPTQDDYDLACKKIGICITLP